MAALKENTKRVFEYVKAHEDENITLKDIAKALEISVQSVNGSVLSFQKANAKANRPALMERVEAIVENEDGTADKVKLIKLTDAGREFDVNAQTDAE